LLIERDCEIERGMERRDEIKLFSLIDWVNERSAE
jgi:hypothetical protein